MTDPAVTVVMPSYNHERFIASAIGSVLAQTFGDFELVIVDDGSRDGSRDVISGFSDSRIRPIFLPQNVGACEAMNIAVRAGRAPLVAVCNSDDEWMPERLERQLPILAEGSDIGAVFSNAEWIDQDGNPTAQPKIPGATDVFAQPNRSRWMWLRNLIEEGNCLCHPSLLIRRAVYDRVGLYDNRLRQLPDFDMWLRVARAFDIFVMPEKLIRFRRHENNTSRWTLDIMRRSVNEIQFIIEKTILPLSAEEFTRAFGSQRPVLAGEIDLRIEKALYLLAASSRYRLLFRATGLRLLYELFDEPAAAERLASVYGFSVADFHREMGLSAPDLSVNPPDAARLDAKQKRLAERLASRERIIAAREAKRLKEKRRREREKRQRLEAKKEAERRAKAGLLERLINRNAVQPEAEKRKKPKSDRPRQAKD